MLKNYSLFLIILGVLLAPAAKADSIDPWQSTRLFSSDRELGTLLSRGDDILGGTRTVVTRNDARVEISRYSDEADSGRVTVQVVGNAQGEAVFTWDGDASHHTTSSLGLDCLDLTRNGDTFFLLKDVVLVRMFGKSNQPPPRALEVEVQGWSGDDATGQRYSRGTIRRIKALPVRDLIIPFSNLINHGPHGGWNPKCVGALRLTFRLPSSGERTVVSFGAFMTSGGHGTKKE